MALNGNASRLKKKHHRAALLILNKLEKQALEGNTAAARIYLSKIIPDLRSVEHSGKVEHELFAMVRNARTDTEKPTD